MIQSRCAHAHVERCSHFASTCTVLWTTVFASYFSLIIPRQKPRTLRRVEVKFSVKRALFQAKLVTDHGAAKFAQLLFKYSSKPYEDLTVSQNEIALTQPKLVKA